MSVVVDHPEHYQGVYSEVCVALLMEHLRLSPEDLQMECIDFIEANDRYNDFLLGNAIKYLWRSGAKCDAQTDLLKALWYLNRWASHLCPDLLDGFEAAISTLILDLENLTN